MRGVTAIAFGALLLAFFLVLVAAMLWQERGRRTRNEPADYVLHDAVAWVRSRLDQERRTRLAAEDVLRILEWQVFYLQESVRGLPRGAAQVVLGPTPDAIAFIADATSRRQQVEYRPGDIAHVLELQGGYLEAIGAVAGPAGRRVVQTGPVDGGGVEDVPR